MKSFLLIIAFQIILIAANTNTDQISIQILPISNSISKNKENTLPTLVKIKTEKNNNIQRLPYDLILVLDQSGSMDEDKKVTLTY